MFGQANGPRRHCSKFLLRAWRQPQIQSLDPRVLLASDLANIAAPVSPMWFSAFDQDHGTGISAAGSIEQTITEIYWGDRKVDVYAEEWIVQLDWSEASLLGSVQDATTLLIGAPVSYEIVSGLGLGGQLLIRTDPASPSDIQSWLSANPSVDYFEPNSLLPVQQVTNDPSLGQLWGLTKSSVPTAWDTTMGDVNAVVAVIDTGVDFNHPDLIENVWSNPGEIAGNGRDDDNNGFVDDVHGFDFVNNDGNPMDDNNHGTHVAGTIAATANNNVGVVGIAPQTKVMALKFMDADGSGSTADAVRAINYATMMKNSYGVNVVVTNNSWGGGGYSQSVRDAIAASGNANILFVAAAGNENSNNDQNASYPANYDLPNVISVAATDAQDQLASFSNSGVQTVDIAAPGVSILSTVPGGGYSSFSGTSMAAPHVAGVAALVSAAAPGTSSTLIRDAILSGVDVVSQLQSHVSTGGRLNAAKALEQLGMKVVTASIASGSILSTPVSQLTLNFSHPINTEDIVPGRVAIGGTAATSYQVIDSDSVRFNFAGTPTSSEGPYTITVAANAVRRSSDGSAVAAWSSAFFYDQQPLRVSSTSVDHGPFSGPPTQIDIHFSEPVNGSSVSKSDFGLSVGSITNVAMIDSQTARLQVAIALLDQEIELTLNPQSVLDQSGNPGLGHSVRFTVAGTSVTRHLSSDVDVPLVDYGTLLSRLTISEPLLIQDVDVELSLDHSWDSDLDVHLLAPDGTIIELFSDVGGDGDGFRGTILDSEAAQSITQGIAPFSGRYRPEGDLSNLDGKSAQGVWTLRIVDDYWADTGTLRSWGLRIDANSAPVLSPIADIRQHALLPMAAVPLLANDPDGDSITFTAQAYQHGGAVAAQLDAELGLWSHPNDTAANYQFNSHGQQEKYIKDGGGNWLFLLSDGSLHRWVGTIEASPKVAQLEPRHYADPALLYDPTHEGSIDVSLQLDQVHDQLSIFPQTGYVGTFHVRVAALDGNLSSMQQFDVTIDNSAPAIAPISDQLMQSQENELVVDFSVNDTDGDAITLTVEALDTNEMLARELDQTYGFWSHPSDTAANYHFDERGVSEKYFRAADKTWYFVLPSGAIHRWAGSIATSPRIATLDSRFHADPARLYQPGTQSLLNVGFQVNQQLGHLTVVPPAGFAGSFVVQLVASDGWSHATSQFEVSRLSATPTANNAPSLQAIADRTGTPGVPLAVSVVATDTEGDSVTLSAELVDENRGLASELDQQLGLWSHSADTAKNYHYNVRGHGEKYVKDRDKSWLFLLPSGALHRWDDQSIETSPLVAQLDSRFHADPRLLYESLQTPTTTPQLSVNQATDQIIVTSNNAARGVYAIHVTASDGTQQAHATFHVSYDQSAPTLGTIPTQQLASGGTKDISLSVSDHEGAPISLSAIVVDVVKQRALDLDAQLKLWSHSADTAKNFYYNLRGQGEKYLKDMNNLWYFLLPNGSLHRWEGSMESSPRIASLDSRYHANPALLYNSLNPPAMGVTASVDGQTKQLRLAAPAGYRGQFEVRVSASDGHAATLRTVQVTVS